MSSLIQPKPELCQRRRRRADGFSMVEMLVTIAIGLIAAGMAFIAIQPVVKSSRINNAYAITLTQMQRARQAAVTDRKTYLVTFTVPGTVQIQRLNPGAAADLVIQADLPADVQFRAEAGIPKVATPDGFGTGQQAIDFDVDFGGGYTQIYFQPDGSAQDNLGRTNNGVIYIARVGELMSSRAISLYGSTGRIKGWRLEQGAGGTYVWNAQ